LAKLFAEIDADASGSISLDELLEGYDSNQQMQNLYSKLDITRDDIGMIFELMDTERVGELSYDSLIENLRMCQMEDTRKSLTMLRLQTAELARCYKRSNSQVQEIAKTFSDPQLSQDIVKSISNRGLSCNQDSSSSGTMGTFSGAELSSSASAADANVQAGTTMTPMPLYTSEKMHHKSAQVKDEQKYQKQQQFFDVEAFDTEVAELRLSLDRVLAGVRDSIIWSCNSVRFAHGRQPSTDTAHVYHTHQQPPPCKLASGGLMQPPFDGSMLSVGHVCVERLPEMRQIPRVGSLVKARDVSL